MLPLWQPCLSIQILEATHLGSKLHQIVGLFADQSSTSIQVTQRISPFSHLRVGVVSLLYIRKRSVVIVVALETRHGMRVQLANVDPTQLEKGLIRKFIYLIVGSLTLAASAHGETVGVVMMHGKHGTPAQLQQLAAAVANAGFLVERPEMCWSAARIYDRSYLECFADIDAAAARLKEHGVTAIVVLGMSLGGNAALDFGARRQGLKAIIALAPAHSLAASSTPSYCPKHRYCTGCGCSRQR